MAKFRLKLITVLFINILIINYCNGNDPVTNEENSDEVKVEIDFKQKSEEGNSDGSLQAETADSDGVLKVGIEDGSNTDSISTTHSGVQSTEPATVLVINTDDSIPLVKHTDDSIAENIKKDITKELHKIENASINTHKEEKHKNSTHSIGIEHKPEKSDEEEPDAKLKAENPAEIEETKVDTRAGDKSKGESKVTSMDTKSGKIMHAVTEAIKGLNPIGLLRKIELDSLLNINGLNIDKIKAPLSFFSNKFFDLFSEEIKISKKELGKELGVDLESNDLEAMMSVGKAIRVGKKYNLNLGDYVDFLGIDTDKYFKEYEKRMTEFVRAPVEMADKLLDEGFHKLFKYIREYINRNGGPMNAALTAYGEATGKDVLNATHNAIDKVKHYSIKKQAKNMTHSVQDAYKAVGVRARKWANEKFGKKSDYQKVQTRMKNGLNDILKFMGSLFNKNRITAFVDLVGKFLGPTGRSILYIVYSPAAAMANQVFGPLLLIPKILVLDSELFDKILALPPVIIQMSGGLFKPILSVLEPLVRLIRFYRTGQYHESLSSGLSISAQFGINIWGGAYKAQNKQKNAEPKIKHNKREKRDTKQKKSKGSSKKGQEFESKRELGVNQKLAEGYQGGPPPGGYKLGVPNDGKADLDDEDMISRILLTPDFILKAGGNLWIPFSSVAAPVLRSLNIVFFGTAEFMQRISEVPEIIKGVGLVGPLSDVIKAMLPFIKVGKMFNKGELSTTDIVMQAPNLVKQATNGVLLSVWKEPMKLLKAMFSWLDGDGGVLAMLRIQFEGDVPKFRSGASAEFKAEASAVTDTIGEFFGGWFMQYVEAMGPIGSMIGALFNGILGNVVDPVKYLDSNPNLRTQPFKNMINSFVDTSKLYKAAADRHMFLVSLLGGQDPDPLKEIGINVEKLVENNIDVAYLLTSGTKLLSPEAKKLVSSESQLKAVGVDINGLKKVDLDGNTFLESGLLDANQDKLRDSGIDIFSLINRVLRNSIVDKYNLMMAGVNPKVMLKAGIDPAMLLCGGIGSVKDKVLKSIEVDKKSLTPDSMKKLGINSAKLHSKGLDAKKLLTSGIEVYEKEANDILGIDYKKLMTSCTYGLEPKKALKGGIDVRKLMAHGIDPRHVLVGGLRGAIDGGATKESLLNVGIDVEILIDEGINVNLVLDIGAASLNPIGLLKLGIDPMRTLISTLSRSGLDELTGGLDDNTSAAFGFVSSLMQISKQVVGLMPLIHQIPGIGPMIMSKDGKLTGIPGFIINKVVGLDNHGGLMPFLKKIFGGKLTMSEILLMLNPLRVAETLAEPKKNVNSRYKSKDARKPVDEYISSNLKMKQKSPKASEQSEDKMVQISGDFNEDKVQKTSPEEAKSEDQKPVTDKTEASTEVKVAENNSNKIDVINIIKPPKLNEIKNVIPVPVIPPLKTNIFKGVENINKTSIDPRDSFKNINSWLDTSSRTKKITDKLLKTPKSKKTDKEEDINKSKSKRDVKSVLYDMNE